MIKNIITVTVVSLIVLSCNNNGEQKVAEKKNKMKQTNEQAAYGKLVYLDTAESIYNILCQDWVLEDDADGIEGMTESSQFEVPYRSFYFSTKGTFLKNPRNTFDYGTWDYDDAVKTITANNTIDKTKDIYKIARVTATELTLVNASVNSSTNLKFIAPGKRFKNANDEPYCLENNRWRIKPKQKETDSAIHQRLKENIHFFILFYKSALAKDDQVVSFWGLPSCFKWYGGGIFLKKEAELKENWVACFYDKEQAMQAYKIAERLMQQKYEWPKGEHNWIKQNLYVVEQMYKKIDELR